MTSTNNTVTRLFRVYIYNYIKYKSCDCIIHNSSYLPQSSSFESCSIPKHPERSTERRSRRPRDGARCGENGGSTKETRRSRDWTLQQGDPPESGPTSSKISWKTWENVGKSWKMWENVGKCWEDVRGYGKMLGKFPKSWLIRNETCKCWPITVW